MMRSVKWFGLLVVAALSAPHVLADVKTREKTTIKFEGLLGGFINRMARRRRRHHVDASRVKGNRMSSHRTTPDGQIMDLAEQKIYQVDVKKKEYKVMTFAEMRAADGRRREGRHGEADAEMKPEEKQAVRRGAASRSSSTSTSRKPASGRTSPDRNAKQVILTVADAREGQDDRRQRRHRDDE